MNKNLSDVEAGQKLYHLIRHRAGQRARVEVVTVSRLTPTQVITTTSGGREERFRITDGRQAKAPGTWDTPNYARRLDDPEARHAVLEQNHHVRSARLIEAVQRFESEPTQGNWESIRQHVNMLAHVHGYQKFDPQPIGEATTTD